MPPVHPFTVSVFAGTPARLKNTNLFVSPFPKSSVPPAVTVSAPKVCVFDERESSILIVPPRLTVAAVLMMLLLALFRSSVPPVFTVTAVVPFSVPVSVRLAAAPTVVLPV